MTAVSLFAVFADHPEEVPGGRNFLFQGHADRRAIQEFLDEGFLTCGFAGDLSSFWNIGLICPPLAERSVWRLAYFA